FDVTTERCINRARIRAEIALGRKVVIGVFINGGGFSLDVGELQRVTGKWVGSQFAEIEGIVHRLATDTGAGGDNVLILDVVIVIQTVEEQLVLNDRTAGPNVSL